MLTFGIFTLLWKKHFHYWFCTIFSFLLASMWVYAHMKMEVKCNVPKSPKIFFNNWSLFLKNVLMSDKSPPKALNLFRSYTSALQWISLFPILSLQHVRPSYCQDTALCCVCWGQEVFGPTWPRLVAIMDCSTLSDFTSSKQWT